MARSVLDMLEEDGPEDEAIIPHGVLDEEEKEPPAAPVASAPKPAGDILDEAFAYVPPPKPKEAPVRDEELAAAQAADARSRRFGRASDALLSAFSRRGFQSTGGGTDKAGALLKRRGQEQAVADRTRQASERTADRAAIAKALGLDEEALAGLSTAGLEKVTGVKVGERKAAAEAERRRAEMEAAAKREAERRALEEQRRKEDRQFTLGRDRARDSSAMERAKLSAEARSETADRLAENRARDTASGMRKEFLGNQVVKDTQQVASAWQKMQGASKDPSAAGDISLVYSFMKMMDPGSVVREGEFATAANAGSVDERVLSTYNKLLSGERLAPSIREDFMRQAKSVLEAQMQRFGPLRDSYARLAERAGLAPEDVALDLGLGPPREGGGGGKIRVSNGTETLEIDAADLAEAEADGFKAVR